MSHNRKLQSTLTLYSLLLSGILFRGIPTDGDATLACWFYTLLFLCLLLLLFRLYGRLNEKNAAYLCPFPVPLRLVLCTAGLLCCLWLYAELCGELSGTIPTLSREFSGGRFTHLFRILSLALALYLVKGEAVSFSRMALLLLPFLLFPPILTCFDFLDSGAITAQLLPSFSLEWKPSYLKDAMQLGGYAFLLLLWRSCLPEQQTDPQGEKEPGLVPAFLLFLLTVTVETVKYVLFFGARGLTGLTRPDRTMLALVPYMNLQELFIFVYYFSYVLKSALVLGLTGYFIRRILFLCMPWRSVSHWFGTLSAGILSYGVYLLFSLFPGVLPSDSSIPLCLITAGGLCYEAAKALKLRGTVSAPS